jgi:hypothetical protein
VQQIITNPFVFIMMSLSSPVKKSLQPIHAPHVRQEVQSFVVPKYVKKLTLVGFWQELEYSPEDFKNHNHRLSDHWRPKEDFGDYMNEISGSMLKYFTALGEYLLKSLVV